MELREKTPPREFNVGRPENPITIRDCGELWLEPNEMVTMMSPDGLRHDFTAKNWGFYATPSVNGRLKSEGFKTALVRNLKGYVYVMCVAKSSIEEFEAYCRHEQQSVLEWLDEREIT